MFNRQKTNPVSYKKSTSVTDEHHYAPKKKARSSKTTPIGVILGVLLTLITIILQCIAFFTPHWKEISATTPSLYVDGVDALIRTEVLHYFDSIHRSTRQSYGLFQRCEYVLSNSSISNQPRNDLLGFGLNKNRATRCTKNFLPSFRDEDFNECHSLSYYRFCTKASEKLFDINNDHLRATFDVSPASRKSVSSTFSCDCHYPPYVTACHIIGIFALIFLCLTSLFFSLFLFISNPHHRLKLKCFGGFFFVLATLFILINLLITLQHFQYESIEYLIAIERHYKSNQIYKLSQDTKTAIDRFLSSIQIQIGYSTVIGWMAFVLSIINGVFFLATCKVTHDKDEQDVGRTMLPFTSLPNDEHQTSIPLTSTRLPSDFQSPHPPAPVLNNPVQSYSLPSNSHHQRGPQSSRYVAEDEV